MKLLYTYTVINFNECVHFSIAPFYHTQYIIIMLVQVEQLVWPTLSHQIRHKLSLHYPTELCTLHLYIFYNIDLRSAIAIITAHKECTCLTHVKLNTDKFGVWSGLKLNVQKCGCLSVINNSSRYQYVEEFSPSYGD